MRQKTLTHLSARLLPIARQAGSGIMPIYYDEQSCARNKADHSPINAADLAAHAVLIEALGALIPAYPVVSEEGESSFTHRNDAGSHWLIDLPNGTKDFSPLMANSR